MAYFRCTSGSVGGGATITVTYDSSFYNKTITCSMGGTTYTKTTTSSGSTEFSVKDEGTWTITCNGVSRTVDVVLNYTTTMAITLSVTVYGAASDTISFTDSVGSKTVTTNSSGVGSTNITIIPPSQTITFTSTVAKNPANLSANYAKNVSLTASSTEVRVMPDNAFYWYGYKTNDFQICSTANGWTATHSATVQTPTLNTNYIGVSVTSNNLVAVAKLTAPVNGNKLKIISTVNVSAHSGIRVFGTSNKQVNLDSILVDFGDGYESQSPRLLEYTYTNTTSYFVIGGSGAEGRGGNIYALMVE